MRSSSLRMRATGVSTAVTLAALTFVALAAAGGARSVGDDQPAQTAAARPAAEPFVGVWEALLPNGLRAGSLAVVPAAGGGVAGAFVGYDYDRTSGGSGESPKVTTRTGSALIAPALGGGALTFSMQLRMTSPPPGAPEYFDVRGEMRLTGEGAGELKLFSPRAAEPLTLRLARE